MKMEDNEHVSIHELRGFSSDTLKGAFREAEAISSGRSQRESRLAEEAAAQEEAAQAADAAARLSRVNRPTRREAATLASSLERRAERRR